MGPESPDYFEQIWAYLVDPALMIAVIIALGYLFRDWIAKLFTSSIQHKFNAEIESIKAESRDREIRLQAEIRQQERVLDRNSEFIGSLRRERSSILQSKRIEAIEIVMLRCKVLATQAVTVEMIKMIKGDYLKDVSENLDKQKAMSMMCQTLGVDAALEKLNSTETTLPNLYLPDRALNLFNAYQGIVMHAMISLKSASLGLDANLLKENGLRSIIEPVWPASKEGFDKFGNGFGYYWFQSAYDQLIKELRSIASGEQQRTEDVVSAVSVAVESEKATMSAKASMDAASIPTTEPEVIQEQSRLVNAERNKTDA